MARCHATGFGVKTKSISFVGGLSLEWLSHDVDTWFPYRQQIR